MFIVERLGQRPPGGAIQRFAVAGSILVSLWGCLNAGNGSGLSSRALSKEMEPSATLLPPRSDSSGAFAIDFRERVLLFLLWTASWGEEKLHE